MSLVTYPNSNTSKPSRSATKKAAVQLAGAEVTITGRLRGAFTAAGKLLINVFDAIAEARVQKAILEAELYQRRYLHTSKNDDDLPVR